MVTEEPVYFGVDMASGEDMTCVAAVSHNDGVINVLGVERIRRHATPRKILKYMNLVWMRSQLTPAKNRSNRVVKKLFNSRIKPRFYV